MSARPTSDDMRLAAGWLEINEGDDGESDACSRVASWLYAQAEQSDLRLACREIGIRVSDFRKIVKGGK